MESTPRSIRPHIAIFGRRNVGKSSLINALTRQSIALVSDTPGTTADPVYKNMELLPFGPVVLIDTAGLDDVGELGLKRVDATRKVLTKTDLALVVLEPCDDLVEVERELIGQIQQAKIPHLVLVNKCDSGKVPEPLEKKLDAIGIKPILISSKTNFGIQDLREKAIQEKLKGFDAGVILGDLVKPGDIVVLVTPIDLAAPKGRLILPQVQAIRDLLDSGCMAMVTREFELKASIESLKKPPALVVTDSQAFEKVAADVPPGVPFTSFSVLFARYKGDLPAFVEGVKALDKKKTLTRVLIAESCTHHQVEDDIGRVKLPNWLRKKFGGDIEIVFSQGVNFPDDLKPYDLVVQCGGCMTNRRAILHRIEACRRQGVPITNYGILIAYLLGVLENALKPLGLSTK